VVAAAARRLRAGLGMGAAAELAVSSARWLAACRLARAWRRRRELAGDARWLTACRLARAWRRRRELAGDARWLTACGLARAWRRRRELAGDARWLAACGVAWAWRQELAENARWWRWELRVAAATIAIEYCRCVLRPPCLQLVLSAAGGQACGSQQAPQFLARRCGRPSA
jgi:hypothetical protein